MIDGLMMVNMIMMKTVKIMVMIKTMTLTMMMPFEKAVRTLTWP